jgi:hypothetical protein
MASISQAYNSQETRKEEGAVIRYILLSVVAIAVFLVSFTVSQIIVASHDNPAPVPRPAITGSYSTRGLPGGNACHHTGAGWIVVPEGAAGQVFQVKDVYYCAGMTGGAVIQAKGKPFNLFLPFRFSKAVP